MSVRRIGLTLALGGLMVVVDTTVTVVALPEIVAGLNTTLPAVQWVTTGYLLGIVAVIPLAGWTSTRFGARRVYLTALLVFTLFSVLAGLAWSAASLALFRVLQGLGGGLLNPVGQAIGLRAAPRDQRGRLMSLLVLPLLIGPAAGPLLGGWLVDTASWRWIFLINVPLGLAALLICARVLPADPLPSAQAAPKAPGRAAPEPSARAALERSSQALPGGSGRALPEPSNRAAHERSSQALPEGSGQLVSDDSSGVVSDRSGRAVSDRSGRAVSGRSDRVAPGAVPVDWAGLAQLSGGAVLVVLGGTLLDRPGGVSWPAAGLPAGLLVFGALLLAAFVRRARRVPDPLVDLRLLAYRPLRAGLAVLVCFGAAYFGSMSVLPLYVQGVRGDSAGLVGLLMLPSAVAVGVVAQVATRLVDKVPPRRIVLTGTTLALLGAAGLAATTVTEAGYPWIIAASVLLSAGSGATIMPTMTVALRDLANPETPRGTTLLALSQQLASALGGAAVAVILSGLITARVAGGVAEMLALNPAAREAQQSGLAAAVGGTYLFAVLLLALSVTIAARSLHPDRTPTPTPATYG
ncbi:MFS transporter [Actinoplanes aureus]|uniref:MFS transporter n=1 Tax=Actinoplanes aureus TaxID=2792083 RepID=A0A931C510_9ACTN|nr:MFS transporter [Actinoplanes aureus]MBG0561171.1 MFS transporter [Actinoplanes aureus]